MKIMGYQRENGAFGVRNYVAVIPSVFCADHAAQRIADQVKSAVAMPHPVGCGQHGEDLDQTVRTLIGLGRDPNVGAVLLVGLGCERVSVQELYDGIAPTGKPVECITIQECGGTVKTIAKGVRSLPAWPKSSLPRSGCPWLPPAPRSSACPTGWSSPCPARQSLILMR